MKKSKAAQVQPRVVQVSVTDRCQCACRHCGVSYLKAGGRRPDPPFENIKRIFEDLRTFGCELVDLFGGEPTLRPDLPELVALGASMGFTMLLETNGLLLTPAYVRKLKKAGLSLVYLSLDSVDEAEHDANRGRKGVFRAAVGAMRACRRAGLSVHVSTVPKGAAFFESGGMDRFTRFCVENGAERVRVLFPSCVGNWAAHGAAPMTERQERAAFAHVAARWRKYIYVENQDENKVLGGKTYCPAKSIFCHITTAGKVLPCPYLPMAFGDMNEESLLPVFARIQGHPCMKERGSYCPTRDLGFIRRRLSSVGAATPYVEARCENLLRVEGGCNNGCRDCGRDASRLTAAAIRKAASKIDPGYSELEVYGGEPFARKDIFRVLASLPRRFGLNIYSNARAFSYPGLAAKLRRYKVHCVKTLLFSADPERHDAATRVPGSFAQAAAGVRNLCAAGIPVSLFLPEEEAAGWQSLKRLGVASVSSFSRSPAGRAGQVFCFGRGAGRVRLLWVRGAGEEA